MIAKKLILTTKHQLIILVFLAIGLNINTSFNEYAVDDVVVMTQNRFVEKGIKGIPEILTTDFMSGYTANENLLSGGRYRPFALAIFAFEHQFFGTNPLVSHLINILFFVLLIVLLYKLLQGHVFREQNKNLAFITCLLFVVHPIHTEVIANVKSRDELIAFILLIVSLITLLKHTQKRSVGMLLAGLFYFFLALLTRESAVTFLGVFPLILYFFFSRSVKQSILFTFPLIFTFIIYMIIRFSVIGFKEAPVTDILNDPFLYATASQAFATKIFILLKYMSLLVFPHPLSSDYSYNQIPYIDLFSIQFILSLFFLLSIIVYSIYAFKKKSLLSFGILYFTITIFLFSNLLINIGAPLAERLLFQPSLAFCIIVASAYIRIEKRSKILANSSLLALLFLFSVKTIIRNHEWKNNETLYLADVISAPNSVRTNVCAADSYILKTKTVTNNKALENEYLKNAIYYSKRSLKIDPKFAYAYLTLGIAHLGINDYFKTADLWKQAYNLDPNYPGVQKATEMISSILFKEGNKDYEKGNIEAAIRCYQKSTELNTENVEAWYNLGGNYFLINDTKSAIEAWQNVLKRSPDHQLNKEQFHLH